jgi:predicted transposase YbfD/YdcC
MSTPTDTPKPLDIPHFFADLPDPRHPAFRYHLLSEILVMALAAVLSGATSWETIAAFALAKHDWFRSLGLKLPYGIPSHDTFARIFAALNPRAFQNCFTAWINAVCGQLAFCHIPIDGKTVRGSRGPDGTCLHLVSAWAAKQRLSLAQVAVPDQGNEITAIPELLRLLELQGALVSIDAIGCQKAIAAQIREGGGDYLLAVKDNQPTLYADIQACFERAWEMDYVGVKHDILATQEESHGRWEERVYTVLYEPAGLSTQAEWCDLRSVLRVIRTRQEKGRAESVAVTYYISSSTLPAAVLGEGVRTHWSIENGQHWCLDVLFAEDHCRSRTGHATENLAWLRKMALSLLRQEKSKGTGPTKLMRAAVDDDYRYQMLNLLCEKYA